MLGQRASSSKNIQRGSSFQNRAVPSYLAGSVGGSNQSSSVVNTASNMRHKRLGINPMPNKQNLYQIAATI